MSRQFCLTGYSDEYFKDPALVQKMDGDRVACVMESTAFALTGTPSQHHHQQFAKQRLIRQASDTGQESGIGSDSDSGHSAIYLDSYGETFYTPAVDIFAAPAFQVAGPTAPSSAGRADGPPRQVGGHSPLSALNSYQTEIRRVCYDGLMADMDWEEQSGNVPDRYDVSGGYEPTNDTMDYDMTERFDNNNNRQRNAQANMHVSNNDGFLGSEARHLSNGSIVAKNTSNPRLAENYRYSGARKELFPIDDGVKHPIYTRSISDNQPTRNVHIDRQYFREAKQFVSINKNLAAYRDGYDRQMAPHHISSSTPQIGSQQLNSISEKRNNGTTVSGNAVKQDVGRRFRRASELADEYTKISSGSLQQEPGSVNQPNYNSLPWGGDRHDSRLQLPSNYSNLADSSLEIEYSPEKLRMQCESLQMRLSNDFAAPIRGYSAVAAEAETIREARKKEIQRTRQCVPAGSHPLDGSYGSVENFPGSTARQLSSSSVSSNVHNNSTGVRTPIRQLSPDAGVPLNPAFQVDEPATLPRPGRTQVTHDYVVSTEPRTKPGQPPTRRWTIMDRTPKMMKTMMSSASKLVNKVVTPARQNSTPVGLDGSDIGSQDLPQSVGHQRQSSVPNDIQSAPVKRLTLFSSRNSKSGSSSSVNSQLSPTITDSNQSTPRLQKPSGGEKQVTGKNHTSPTNNSNMASSRLSRREASTAPPANVSEGKASSQVNQNKSEAQGKRSGTSPSISATLKSRFTSPFHRHPRQTSSASDSSQTSTTPVKKEKVYRSRGSSVDGNNNGSNATFSIAAPYLFGKQPDEKKNSRYRKDLAYSPRVAEEKAAVKVKCKAVHPIVNGNHQPVLDGRSVRKLNSRPHQVVAPREVAEEKPSRVREPLVTNLHPDLAPRSPKSPATRESSPGSVTGRSRTNFRTFHGSITPINWSDDDSITPASPRQDIEMEEMNTATVVPRLNSISELETALDKTYLAERLTIYDSHHFENSEDTMNTSPTISSPQMEFTNGKVHMTENTNVGIPRQKVPPENYSTLKSRKLQADDDEPSAKRVHRSKNRSASCSANDDRTRPYEKDSVTFDPKQSKLPSVLLGRQTSDNLTAEEREFLEQISVVSCNEYTGITAGRQAVNDVDLLMDIVKDLLVQPTSQGICFERTITADEFNAARDGLSEVSRRFVVDCKTLVSSAGKTRPLLVLNINSSMKTFIQLIARCREMLFCLSAPDDKKGLVEIVCDVGNGYKRTIASASRAVGKSLHHSHVKQLMGDVQFLICALGRIVQTLAKLEYVRLVRRF